MRKTNLGLIIACTLAGFPLSSLAMTTSDFCLGENKGTYPVHRDRVCSLERWATNQEVPEKRSVLNAGNSSIKLTPDDLAGDVLLSLNQDIFIVNKRYQNCKDVYETFKGEIKKTAGTIECTAGNHDLVPSSYYGSGNGCFVKNNIETCTSSKLTLTPGDVDINQVQRKARYSGVLVKTTKKNELSYRQGYIPVSNGGITFFVTGTVTDRRQISFNSENPEKHDFYAPVNPTPYFELSCLSENPVAPASISLVYKDSTMTDIGFDGSDPVSTFTGENFTTFKNRCVDDIELSLVNYQDIATSDWSVTFKRTGSRDAYVNELVRFGAQLLKDAESVIAEYQTFQAIDMNSGSISDQIRAEISVNWETFANSVQVPEFFDPILSLERYQNVNQSVLESTLNIIDVNGNKMPNFELMKSLVEELKAEHPTLTVGALINPDLEFIYDYRLINQWNSIIVLSKINGHITDLELVQEGSDSNLEGIKKSIAQYKATLNAKVTDISAVIQKFLEIAEKADAAEVEKLKDLKDKLSKAIESSK